MLPSDIANVFTYTPDNHYYGTDSFTWRAWDGELFSDIATVDLTIACVDDPLEFQCSSVIVNEDEAGTGWTGAPISCPPGVLENGQIHMESASMGEDSQFNLTIEAFDADNSDCVSGCITCDNPEGFSVEPFDTTLNALAGINRTIEASGILDSLTLSLDFNALNSTSSWAGDMALVLCAPDGHCIQIGGYDYNSGHPSAGSWPGNWNVSTSNT